MSIVSPLDAQSAPITVRHFFSGGNPGPLAATLAHVPDLMKTALPFFGTALGESGIDLRTKEIVIVRTSYLQRCHYCINTHSMVAFKAGLTQEEVLGLRHDHSPGDAFADPREKALLDWTDVVATGPTPITQALRSAFTAHFDEAEVVELTMLIATTVALNRYASAVGLPVAEAHHQFLEQEGLVFCS